MAGLQIYDALGRIVLDTETLLLKQVAILPTVNTQESGTVTVPAVSIPPASVPVVSPVNTQNARPSTEPTIEYVDAGSTKNITWRKQRYDVDVYSNLRVDMY